MSKYFLTFEFDKDKEVLEIHGDSSGLIVLRDKINLLLKNQGKAHIHLMIPSWGGEELSEELQCDENQLVPHVKIFKW